MDPRRYTIIVMLTTWLYRSLRDKHLTHIYSSTHAWIGSRSRLMPCSRRSLSRQHRVAGHHEPPDSGQGLREVREGFPLPGVLPVHQGGRYSERRVDGTYWAEPSIPRTRCSSIRYCLSRWPSNVTGSVRDSFPETNQH